MKTTFSKHSEAPFRNWRGHFDNFARHTKGSLFIDGGRSMPTDSMDSSLKF